MHLYESKKGRKFHHFFRMIAAFVVLLLLGLFVLGRAGGIAQGRSDQIVKQAITKAAVTCYTLEGRYPDSLQYLIDHYGLSVNEDRYIIIYEPSGPNLMPTIRVSPRTLR